MLNIFKFHNPEFEKLLDILKTTPGFGCKCTPSAFEDMIASLSANGEESNPQVKEATENVQPVVKPKNEACQPKSELTLKVPPKNIPTPTTPKDLAMCIRTIISISDGFSFSPGKPQVASAIDIEALLRGHELKFKEFICIGVANDVAAKGIRLTPIEGLGRTMYLVTR